MDKIKAGHKILSRLALADEPLALHQLNIPDVSESAAGARLREYTRAGVTVRVKVPGKKFLSWTLAPQSDYDWTTDKRFLKP
jgi:hypothetical protein